MSNQQPTPRWHPISMLGTIAQHIDGMLEASTEQFVLLKPARSKPWVLDNYTVNRVINSFTTQQEDHWLFDEQLRRWSATKLTPQQSAEVARLAGQMTKLREVNTAVLTLAAALKTGTIEQQMAKSDFDKGVEMLRRMRRADTPGTGE